MSLSRDQLITDGGLREQCNEPIRLKCLTCGTELFSLSDWENASNSCPDCGAAGYIFVCGRCEKKFDALLAGGEHPCGSIALYDRTHRIAFEEEARAQMEARRLAEVRAAHRRTEAAERRRAKEEEQRRAEEETRRARELEESRWHAEEEARRRLEYEERSRLEETERHREERIERFRSAWEASKGLLAPIVGIIAILAAVWAGFGYLLLQFDPETIRTAETAFSFSFALMGAVAMYSIAQRNDGMRNGALLFSATTFLGLNWLFINVMPMVFTGSRHFWEPVFFDKASSKKVIENLTKTGNGVSIPASQEYVIDTSVKGKYVVLRNSNIRSGPGVTHGIVTSVPEMSDIEIVGKHMPSGWLQVANSDSLKIPKSLGFISGKLVIEESKCRVVTTYEDRIESWKQWSSRGEISSGGIEYLERLCSTSEARMRPVYRCSESERRNYHVVYEREMPKKANYFAHCRAIANYECPVKKKYPVEKRVCGTG